MSTLEIVLLIITSILIIYLLYTVYNNYEGSQAATVLQTMSEDPNVTVNQIDVQANLVQSYSPAVAAAMYAFGFRQGIEAQPTTSKFSNRIREHAATVDPVATVAPINSRAWRSDIDSQMQHLLTQPSPGAYQCLPPCKKNTNIDLFNIFHNVNAPQPVVINAAAVATV